ncbi:MAG: hypothetical protein K9M75_07560 [Phycisphaerae bacterium]|nr:hypothetical protein [Phycisphaerae bacterium]
MIIKSSFLSFSLFSLWSSVPLSEAKSRFIGMAKKESKPNSQKLQAVFYKTRTAVFISLFDIPCSLLDIHFKALVAARTLRSLVVLFRERLLNSSFVINSAPFSKASH